jgi:hypothetical protein
MRRDAKIPNPTKNFFAFLTAPKYEAIGCTNAFTDTRIHLGKAALDPVFGTDLAQSGVCFRSITHSIPCKREFERSEFAGYTLSVIKVFKRFISPSAASVELCVKCLR